jgi:hypothetical protein
MAEVIRWPFPLPARFLDTLGYSRAVAAVESPSLRARVGELLRQRGIHSALAASTGPRRLVLLYWESAGDELAFSDGVHSGAGQLDHWPWLEYLRRDPAIRHWLADHQVNLGSSENPASHALVIDGGAGDAWVAPMAIARLVVRTQQVEVLIDN